MTINKKHKRANVQTFICDKMWITSLSKSMTTTFFSRQKSPITYDIKILLGL
jgi:hypothetical protein